MIKKILILTCLVLNLAAYSQKHSYIYFIAFKDKNNSIYSIKKPQEFLSEKALLRRAKYNIKTEESDLPVNETYIKKVCDKKIKFKNASKWLNGILVEVSDTDLIANIRKNEFVLATYKVAEYTKTSKPLERNSEEESNGVIEVNNDNTSNDESQSIYGGAYTQVSMLQGIALHQKKFTGEGITIAVLDAGFFNAHKLAWFNKLQSRNQIVLCKDFVDNDNYVFDGNAHGLEVLSCMATGDTGVYIGTAPKAQYLLLRSEDAETEQLVEEINWSVAAEYADSCGVDLITTSLGYNLFDDTNTSHIYSQLDGNSSFVTRAAEMAFSKGMVIVCSAGNEGANVWRHVGFPADAQHALTVGAVNSERVIAYFSSQGPTYDGRVKPDIAAQGVSSAVQSPYGGVTAADGTSFAAPISAGLVACLMQAHPNSTPQQITDAIKQSADRADIPDTIYGNGIPDFYLANLILGDPTFDNSKDNLINISYNLPEKLFSFTVYSASTQMIGFKIIDENGNIIRTGSQQCNGKKFQHFYIDELVLPVSEKGYGFIIENDAHQTFIKLF